MQKDYIDDDDLEDQPNDCCVKCQRSYNDIEYDFQWCQKCGWDDEKKKYEKPIEPTRDDYIAGEADILTGRWT